MRGAQNMVNRIYYRSGYKYQLAKEYIAKIGFTPSEDIITEFIEFYVTGLFRLRRGYTSDGPSGLTFDTPDFMRGSFEHDAGYQLLRMGLLSPEYREKFDDRLRLVCLEDGMSEFRAAYVYASVRTWGADSANPENIKKVFVAPRLPAEEVEEKEEY